MSGDVVIPARDLAEAVDIVRRVFGQPGIGSEAAEARVRRMFAVRWPHWSDRELELALRAALRS